MYQLTHCKRTDDLWIINDETEEVLKFEDINLTLEDVLTAINRCDGCALNDEEDVHRVIQTLLDTAFGKSDSRKT